MNQDLAVDSSTSKAVQDRLAGNKDISKYRQLIIKIVETFGVSHDKAEFITKSVISLVGSVISLVTVILGILHGTGVI